MLDDDARAGRGPSVEGARFERRVHRRPCDAVSARLGLEERLDLRVVLTGSLRVASPEDRAAAGDHAADPRVVARRAARAIALGDRKLHQRFVVRSRLRHRRP